MKIGLLAVGGYVAFSLVGCGNSERISSNVDPFRHEPAGYDDIVVDDRQQKDLLLTTDPGYGPDHVVMVSVRVPEAYYSDGAIHLTGGREMHLVPPHSWNTYTGSAMTSSEAAQVIARARAIDEASEEYRDSVTRLRQVLEAQAKVVENAKVDAYDQAALRHSELHLARTKKETAELKSNRERLQKVIDRESAVLAEKKASLVAAHQETKTTLMHITEERQEMEKRILEQEQALQKLREKADAMKKEAKALLNASDAAVEKAADEIEPPKKRNVNLK